MALPFLPGNSFNRNLGKSKYHKSHHFDYNNDVSLMVGECKPGIGGETMSGQKQKANQSNIPRGAGCDLPAWVAFDRQVLCFDAFFQEAVYEKREEQFRIRNCKVYFYLEDDSIQVIEPRSKNSGVPQGTLIRRHRIPKPAPYDDLFYTVEDFNVGKEVTLYSRVFKITDSDEFTRNFLGKLGVKVNQPNTTIPDDPYMQHRKAMDESMQPLRPYEKHDTLKQFLDHDRHVLRFYCFWDDSDEMFGDPREMVLHYFLADDTIEIREIIPANSGRDATPMFLKRCKLPKAVESLKQPGVSTDRTVLNVFGPMGAGGRYILDSLKTGAVSQAYYTEADLTMGSVISVWGRKFMVCDCDEFTREYYRTKYNITDFPSMKYKHDPSASAAREVPPYNGFGSEEDSLCSCMALLPKPPKRDFIKFMEKDRHGLESNVLRFLAKMDTTKPIDMDRRFIISYFLSDDTILVFEPPVRNSGTIGGKFLERGRVRKPDQPSFSTQLSEYYGARDLHVGTVVEFNRHRFILIDADDYAYNYMERHTSEFVHASIGSVMSKLNQLAGSNRDELSRSGSGTSVPYDQFRSMIVAMTQGRLSEHEIITIARFYQDRKDDNTSAQEMVAMAQEQLRKANFDQFPSILEHCIKFDKDRTGYLDPEGVRSVCNTLKLPLQDDMLRVLLSMMPQNSGLINYAEFVNCVNWRDHAVAPLVQRTSQSDSNWQGNQPGTLIQCVNVQALVQDLLGGGPQ